MRANKSVTFPIKLLTIVILFFASHFNMSCQSSNRSLRPIETPLVGRSVIPIHIDPFVTTPYTRLLFDFGDIRFYYFDVRFMLTSHPPVYFGYMEDLGEVLIAQIVSADPTLLYEVDFQTFEKKEVGPLYATSGYSKYIIIDYDDATSRVKTIYSLISDSGSDWLTRYIKVSSPDLSEFRSLLLEYKRNRSTR